ncbi:MAG: hypothetical protein ACD_50C00153G0025 [uncultured bacterium]|nr:MAG: hypothetical protein ACD_50C00153G0025 [uncultured bacterium]
MSVSQFSVDDVQTGDLVLDFAANCIINCGGPTTVKNTGNGTGSQNTGDVNTIENDNTFQNNDASIENDLILSSNSGDNTANQNTGGDSFIQTGDANVSANVLTFANNNFSGNVILGVVDIFGTLNGDIVLTDEAIARATGAACSTCLGNTTVSNTNNGSGSESEANVNRETNNTTLQNNNANIENNLKFDAQTGNNTANQNTGGDTFIETGNSEINAQTLNIANSNIEGGNWWLVVVNKAGQWVGQLLGAPTGSLMAGSEGTEFNVAQNGEITATNNGNGSDSNNNATVNQETNNTTSQTNNANIVNNIDLSANTGENNTSQNTGGSNTIKTGDATIIANLVNFVNNNIVGNQKLVVTVVNVFGDWFGDFVTPGFQKENNTAEGENGDNLASENTSAGGPLESSQNQNSSNASQGSSDNSTSVSSDPISTSNTSNPSSPSSPSVSSNPSNSSSQSNSSTALVAGISSSQAPDASIDTPINTAITKGIRINLAWMFLMIPAALIYFLIKKKFNPLKHFIEKKN